MSSDLEVGRMMQIGKGVLFLVLMLSFVGLKSSAAELEGLSGAEQWKPYLEQVPQNINEFVADPLKTLLKLLPEDPIGFFSSAVHSYADVLLFLVVAMIVSFFVGKNGDRALLELLTAGGCGVILWKELTGLAASLCERMESWRVFLLGFLPVYSGVLAAGGEVNASTAASGMLLVGLCALAQAISFALPTLLQCYLAISMACCISTQAGLPELCQIAGKTIRQGLGWAGRGFSILVGVQRFSAAQLDRTAMQVGRFVSASVPVVGQALVSATEAVFSGFGLLKSSLGIAGVLIIGAEFVPLYISLMVHLLFLQGCKLLATVAGNDRGKRLIECFCESVRCMAAVTALFFGTFLVGMLLMSILGGN